MENSENAITYCEDLSSSKVMKFPRFTTAPERAALPDRLSTAVSHSFILFRILPKRPFV